MKISIFQVNQFVLFSLTAITNDPSYTAVTILDGRQQASVIKAVSRENIQIIGFTICNGNGNTPNYYNSCTGGGVDLFHSSAVIKNCIIENNKADMGGGICMWTSFATLSATTIKFNSSTEIGGGIALMDTSSVTFDVAERCNIYKNMAPFGSDIYKQFRVVPFTLVVDTFTVLQPDDYFLMARDYNFMAHTVTVPVDILHAYLTPVCADLYVSPTGNDTNDGLTDETPLKTIQYAIMKIQSDSTQTHTIHLASGIYSPSLNQQFFPIGMRGSVSLIGDSLSHPILDAECRGKLFCDMIGDFNYSICNLHCQNTKNWSNNYYFDNRHSSYNKIWIKNVVIENDSAMNTLRIKQCNCISRECRYERAHYGFNCCIDNQ